MVNTRELTKEWLEEIKEERYKLDADVVKAEEGIVRLEQLKVLSKSEEIYKEWCKSFIEFIDKTDKAIDRASKYLRDKEGAGNVK